MLTRVRGECAYWSRMTQDVKEFRESCDVCNAMALMRAENTQIPLWTPMRPMEMLAADCMEVNNGKSIIAIGVQYSGYMWVV